LRIRKHAARDRLPVFAELQKKKKRERERERERPERSFLLSPVGNAASGLSGRERLLLLLQCSALIIETFYFKIICP
jgi:hypothetical protein